MPYGKSAGRMAVSIICPGSMSQAFSDDSATLDPVFESVCRRETNPRSRGVAVSTASSKGPASSWRPNELERFPFRLRLATAWRTRLAGGELLLPARTFCQGQAWSNPAGLSGQRMNFSGLKRARLWALGGPNGNAIALPLLHILGAFAPWHGRHFFPPYFGQDEQDLQDSHRTLDGAHGVTRPTNARRIIASAREGGQSSARREPIEAFVSSPIIARMPRIEGYHFFFSNFSAAELMQ